MVSSAAAPAPPPRHAVVLSAQAEQTLATRADSATLRALIEARAPAAARPLRAFAAERGRRFGIKLTNTLVVANHRGVMPGDKMYLSGAPLHVLAVTLLDRLVEALPGVSSATLLENLIDRRLLSTEAERSHVVVGIDEVEIADEQAARNPESQWLAVSFSEGYRQRLIAAE